MKNILITLVLLIAIIPLNAQNLLIKEKFPKEIAASEKYYAPFTTPLPISFLYAGSGLTFSKANNNHGGTGISFQLGISRAFNINKYVYDKELGYMGKINKFYGYFNFGWLIQRGTMGGDYNNKIVYSSAFDTQGHYETDYYAVSGLELGLGIAYNIKNKVAMEYGYQFILFPSIRKNEVKLKDASGKLGINVYIGPRFKRFSAALDFTMLFYDNTTVNCLGIKANYILGF